MATAQNKGGFGSFITGLTPASLVPHPSGGYALQNLDGTYMSIDSNGDIHWKTSLGVDEQFSKGNKVLINYNAFGNKYFFLQWFD